MSETAYGFDAVRFRAARVAAGVSVARIVRAAGVTERAVSLYLAGSRVPRPEVLPGLAEAVGATPAELCTVEREVLAHLRVVTAERLLAAEQHTREQRQAERDKRWQHLREMNPGRAAMIEKTGRRLREQQPGR
ncbi:helix-turn-helix domain-containing protein [Actinacidiphila glaucinigra]|uniref:helix-turn-helix domain-containing protein n=1 Tax=Actinacidiphila glaucinigra TaxID=235986 RepID=UPI0035D7E1CB